MIAGGLLADAAVVWRSIRWSMGCGHAAYGFVTVADSLTTAGSGLR